MREQVGITDSGGGVMLIVLGGNRGNGFACQADIQTMLALPISWRTSRGRSATTGLADCGAGFRSRATQLSETTLGTLPQFTAARS